MTELEFSEKIVNAHPGTIVTVGRGPHCGAWVKIKPPYGLDSELEGTYVCVGTGEVLHGSHLASHKEWTTIGE